MLPVVIVTQDIGPSVTIDSSTNDMVLSLGDLPDVDWSGAFHVTIAPTDDFIGSFLIVGRNGTADTRAADILFVAYPFRAFYLNGAPADVSVMQVQPVDASGNATPIITSRSDILVPASGARIGIQVVGFTQGKCYIGHQAVTGSSAP